MDTNNHEFLASFLRGMGSILDLFPATPVIEEKTDAEAIASDWAAIGSDFQKVIRVNSCPIRG